MKPVKLLDNIEFYMFKQSKIPLTLFVFASVLQLPMYIFYTVA